MSNFYLKIVFRKIFSRAPLESEKNSELELETTLEPELETNPVKQIHRQVHRKWNTLDATVPRPCLVPNFFSRFLIASNLAVHI